MKLSVITVSLNVGDKLLKTVESTATQTFQDYELIIQDGGSLDGSLEALSDWLAVNEEMAARTRIFQEKDAGIYDGMNRGAAKARGEYLYFLNCGDAFHEADALQEFATGMEAAGAGIFYGNVYDTLRASVVQSNPRMDAFGCYRNVPCHQACVYHRSLFQERGYSLQYRVRADYEHFLWCFLKKQVPAVFIPVTLADYEGGGFSETKENRRRSAAEHRRITALYMTKKQRFCYRAVLVLTLQPLRTALAENEVTGRFYQRVKRALYHK